jgi:hypothetical protein
MRVVYPKQTSLVTMPEGHSVLVPFGSHWAADDPIVRAHPDLFSDDPMNGIYGNPPAESEQATATPGERRNVRRG